jgi:hypothetical protein
MKKEEIISWLQENSEKIDGGYIAAYRNSYEMTHYMDSQFMDLEYESVGSSEKAIRFHAQGDYPASYTLDYSDIIKSTNVKENDGYACKSKYVVLITLKRKNIFIMYFDLKGEKRMDGDLL